MHAYSVSFILLQAARNNTRNTTVNHTLQGVQPTSQSVPIFQGTIPKPEVEEEGVTEEGAAEEPGSRGGRGGSGGGKGYTINITL